MLKCIRRVPIHVFMYIHIKCTCNVNLLLYYFNFNFYLFSCLKMWTRRQHYIYKTTTIMVICTYKNWFDGNSHLYYFVVIYITSANGNTVIQYILPTMIIICGSLNCGNYSDTNFSTCIFLLRYLYMYIHM